MSFGVAAPSMAKRPPSFHIIPATQVWHCFGCGEGGDVFTYIMKRENLSFPESIRYLADRAGIELHDTGAYRERGTKRARIYDLCAETAQFYHTMLMRGKDSRPREYFASRGMGGDVCRRYCLALRRVATRWCLICAGGLYPAGDDRRQRGREPWARAACRPFLRPRDVSHL